MRFHEYYFPRIQMRKRRSAPRVFQTELKSSPLGRLGCDVFSSSTNRPIENAVISISATNQPDTIIKELKTNSFGQTETITLLAPPIEYSLEPTTKQPYSEYILTITAPEYKRVIIHGVQILEGVMALQKVSMNPKTTSEEDTEEFIIPPHTLYGNYPPKIMEDEIKLESESHEPLLNPVMIPEFIIVHDGPPTDASAKDYYVPYRDYIKNVASNEIYATWPESAIYATILAIQSFTLNRVYTEWYKKQGYSFTITSSTAFDHKWVPERNSYDTINTIVDTIFANYLSRPEIRQPILTGYCDGKKVTCPNLMSKWEAYELSEQEHSAAEILKNYYGDKTYINEAEIISGMPSSFTGYTISTGDSGEKIKQLQMYLNELSDVYSSIPKLTIDGIYGSNTATAITEFQKQFNLPQTGVTDFTTWYKVSAIYVEIVRGNICNNISFL